MSNVDGLVTRAGTHRCQLTPPTVCAAGSFLRSTATLGRTGLRTKVTPATESLITSASLGRAKVKVKNVVCQASRSSTRCVSLRTTTKVSKIHRLTSLLASLGRGDREHAAAIKRVLAVCRSGRKGSALATF